MERNQRDNCINKCISFESVNARIFATLLHTTETCSGCDVIKALYETIKLNEEEKVYVI
jgi:hypothetical protein